MDTALQKVLGELLLNAVPTIILFTLLFAAYNFLVHKPLMKVLGERHAKTAGAIAKAQADVAAAEAKTAQYEQRLREARGQVFKRQEQRQKIVQEARSAALAQAREEAGIRLKAAKAEIEKEAAAARAGLQQQSEQLANEVIRAVLRTGSASPVGGR